MARSVDLTRFATAIRQLSSLSGKDLATVLTAEAGKCLEGAVRYTPKADRRKIETQVRKHTAFEFENGKSDAGQNYKTKAGTEWFRMPGGAWFLIQKWRVPVAVWRQHLRALSKNVEDFTRTVDRRIREALARRGMTAATWLQIGKALGVQVKAPGYVAKADTPAGIGTGRVETGGKDATVTGENASQVLINSRSGQRIIDAAIRSRLRFIETAIRKGALQTLESRTRSFPHLFRG